MKRFTINMPEHLHRRLKHYCVDQNSDMTGVVLRLIEELLAKAEKKHKR